MFNARNKIHARKHNPLLRRNLFRGFEPLEDRRLLTLIWANRGDESDMFDAAFGDDAAVARGVVDSALAEWNRVVVGYGGADFETQLTIAMDPTNPATSAFASNTARDSNGVPVTGNVTINMALDTFGNTQWYLDPTPDDHSEFMGTLQHAFARNPTPGGPADGMRDLRTLLVHELGHTMGVASGSPLMYSNPSITMTNTGITDNSVGSGGNSYWLFQGPSVNAVMTDFDINGPVTSSAGHTAMPLAGNTPINFGGQLYYTAIDTMQPTSLSIRRILLSSKVALMMQDMGYDVVPPETFGTFHSVLNSASGELRIQGGNDGTLINNVNQGPSNDTIQLTRVGNQIIIGIDVGVDVPGSGNGLTPLDQQGMFFSQFNINDVTSIRIEGFAGNDQISLTGDLDFLNSLVVEAGNGNDTVNGSGLTGTQLLTAFGDDGNDSLTGGPGTDLLMGLDGNDTISGGGSADWLLGGTGNDTIRGGLGNDVIDGGEDSDNLQGNGGSDSIDGGSGNDFILGGSFVAQFLDNIPDGADTIEAGEGNDFVIGDNALGATPTIFGGAGDTIRGGDDNDTLFGGIGDDRIFGNDGNDILAGFIGNDDLEGDDGNDSLSGEGGNDQLTGGLGTDLLVGGDGNDVLVGGTVLGALDSSNDTLRGGAGSDTLLGDNFGFGPGVGGNDSLDGDEGNDFLYGQFGDDQMRGGLGSDSLFGGDGNDFLVGGTVLGTPDASADELHGDDGNDTLLGDNFGFGPGVGGNDVLQGGSGNDNLYGQYGNDRIEGGDGHDLLIGFDGNDDLDGGDGADELDGGAGNDMLVGGLDSDHLAGGSGDDNLVGGTVLAATLDSSSDTLEGGSGNDTLLGDNFGFGPGIGGADTLLGGSGDDNLYGQYGDDSLDGGADNDFLSGGADEDTLAGGTGDDTLQGNNDNDILAGGDGDDELNGNQGNDSLAGENGNDILRGDSGDDLLRGGNGIDQLFGGDGSDILLGGASRDVLWGGVGRDILIGGIGVDRMAGGDDDDILIAGYTRHDGNDEALFAIRLEWNSRRSYEERVANLHGEDNPTFNDRLNGDYFLRDGIEVGDDDGGNALAGEASRDWFFATFLDSTDIAADELLN